jgi:hypothetical protein
VIRRSSRWRDIFRGARDATVEVAFGPGLIKIRMATRNQTGDGVPILVGDLVVRRPK